MIRMASVEEALALLVRHGRDRRTKAETVALTQSLGRRLAAPALARVSQPPAAVSAMDGYAVRFADMRLDAKLKVVGESRAGTPFDGQVGYREAARIFTGAHIPEGANHVLIQEDTKRDGDTVEVTHDQPRAENIRRKGRDFSAGDALIPAGFTMTPAALSLAAAGNIGELQVIARPRVGVLATGDELAPPGAELAVGQVVNSIQPALMELIRQWGGESIDLGVARDEEADVRARLKPDLDLIVSIGGASVGDYDVVRAAFAAAGFAPVVEKVRVKPGKPTWFSADAAHSGHGRLALGLPGNPAAALVTARLFLKPLLDAFAGAPSSDAQPPRAHVTKPLPAAGDREEYLRAVLALGSDGRQHVTPAEDQDSSLLHPFLRADALIRRPPHAAAALEGELVEFMPLA
jgi:molybdopterin molybdotransferase